jgi:hypothetical protein
VFRSVVDGVHTNGVDTKLLEVDDVALATGRIGDGVLCVGRATWLVVDTADVETLVASEESCNLSIRTNDTSSN